MKTLTIERKGDQDEHLTRSGFSCSINPAMASASKCRGSEDPANQSLGGYNYIDI